MEAEEKENNPFKLIHMVDELPPELKEEVLASVRSVILMKNIGKLFSVDMTKTVGKFLDPGSSGKE